MNRLQSILNIRRSLAAGKLSIGSWMQLPSASVAEIMGQAGYDWVAVDLEHGAITAAQLPDLFRALELGDTLPLVRLACGDAKECKQALDAGAGGVIVPMVQSAEQLEQVQAACCWPPAGTRGVGFSRANLFGKNFEAYSKEAQAPLLVAMIEHHHAIDRLDQILRVPNLDAIFIGPYDLSASMGMTAKFEDSKFVAALNRIRALANAHNVPCGLHVVNPVKEELARRIAEGYRFIAYSMDAAFLTTGSQFDPLLYTAP